MSAPGSGEIETLRVRGPARALGGDVTVPGDKSIGHRAVLFAAIADGHATVRGLSGGEDNRSTIGVLRALGVAIRDAGAGVVEVQGRGLDGLAAAAGDLDCGNSGTSMRLFAGLLASRPFASRLVGDQYLHARPMKRVVEPLTQMGARITGQSGKKPNEIYPPLAIAAAPGRLVGIRYESRVASAQVKSAIVLAALAADGATTVVEPERSRDHTERMLAHLGAPLVGRRAGGHHRPARLERTARRARPRRPRRPVVGGVPPRRRRGRAGQPRRRARRRRQPDPHRCPRRPARHGRAHRSVRRASGGRRAGRRSRPAPAARSSASASPER